MNVTTEQLKELDSQHPGMRNGFKSAEDWEFLELLQLPAQLTIINLKRIFGLNVKKIEHNPFNNTYILYLN
uniref:Uncharacterized protein n=1 Tax=viral metagenome TaxID=1070528 RepID=A0A6M3X4P0_9ZZZZ